MPPELLFLMVFLSFVSSPSAFLLLWLSYRIRKNRYILDLAFALLGLGFIFLGNTAAVVLEDIVKTTDARFFFLIMNAVFLSSVFTGAYLCRFALACTDTPLKAANVRTFWIAAVAFFFLVQASVLFPGNGTPVDAGPGYLWSTVFVTACQAYAAAHMITNRKKLPPELRGLLPVFFTILLVLGVISVGNDIFHYGSLLGGREFPFSPVFFILLNISLAVYCIHELRVSHASGTVEVSGTYDDLGLTERELKILPLLLDGKSNEEIAGSLFISPHTVKNHITVIYRKVGVSNRIELMKRISGRK